MRYVFAFEHGGSHLLELHIHGLSVQLILDGCERGHFLFWPGRVVRLPLAVTEVARLNYSFGALELEVRLNQDVPEVRVAGERLRAVLSPDIRSARLNVWPCLSRIDFYPRGRLIRGMIAAAVPLAVALLLTSGLRVLHRWPELAAHLVPTAQWWPLIGIIWGFALVAAVALGAWFGGEYLRVFPAWGIVGRLRTRQGRLGWLPTPVIASWDAIALVPTPPVQGQPDRLLIRLGLPDDAPVMTLRAESYAGADALELIRVAHRQGIVASVSPATLAQDFVRQRSRCLGLVAGTLVLGGLGAVLFAVGIHTLHAPLGQHGQLAIALGVLLIALWLFSLRLLLHGPRRCRLSFHVQALTPAPARIAVGSMSVTHPTLQPR